MKWSGMELNIIVVMFAEFCAIFASFDLMGFVYNFSQLFVYNFLQVMKRIITEKTCNRSGQCHLLQKHHEFMTPGRRCFEKMLEPVCATIDCKFQARDDPEECALTSRPVNVSFKSEFLQYFENITWKMMNIYPLLMT